ncbi:phage tail protein [Thalassospira sp. UBA1131]|uniref:phage tail protein n=1 Tax=Thalassospira sp. UBA1131 TaxID=1947672 RepID=UPI0025DA2768|nr:phage tail protein [Thalassospira sp. UBA1131]
MQGNTPVECEILNVIQGAGIWPDCDDKTQLLQAIEALISGGGSGGGSVVAGSEIGSVSAFAMPTPPTGWLVCDGSAVSRTEYADLFATIGTLWGNGDQVSTFNLPDLRGEFIRGSDDGRGVDDGRVFASAQADAFQGHKHEFFQSPATLMVGGSYHPSAENFDQIGPYQPGVGVGNPVTDSASGSPRVASETRPRNIAMTYAIKAFYPTSA